MSTALIHRFLVHCAGEQYAGFLDGTAKRNREPEICGETAHHASLSVSSIVRVLAGGGLYYEGCTNAVCHGRPPIVDCDIRNASRCYALSGSSDSWLI